ncbi:YDG/SRA domain-containing protein [Actinoplanes sp. URMC 104]|uniref:YDG/SRA domain-containing protein n=1 Tax=Actinoplanes sp. URMC 104 TaxID=3423409 RepID=UPI003F1C0284
MADRTYGEIAGFPPGSTFTNRRDLAASGVHRPPQGGICGGKDGAESIVVSGGYVDDMDFGHEIIYTGQGGRDEVTGEQVADQELVLGNAGLARSNIEGYLVRVVRGAGGDEEHSPPRGLRYDGLFRVADFWHDTGRNGFRVWRFRLVAHNETPDADELERPEDAGPALRASTTIQRLVRSTAVAQRVKELHQHTCQVCGIRLTTPVGPYAEAAHIRALGKPHDGPDVNSNVLCLCPNHHVLLDTGAIYVDSDWTVRASDDHSVISTLRRVTKHVIDPEQLAYHKNHFVP